MTRIGFFWLLIILGFGCFVFAVQEILLPFIAGLFIAYFIDPLVDKLEMRGMGRTLATSVITGLIVLIFLIICFVLLPLLLKQAIVLIKGTPAFVHQMIDLLSSLKMNPQFLELLGFESLLGHDSFYEYVQILEPELMSMANDIVTTLVKVLERAWLQGVYLVNLLALVVITPVVAFYMLRDWDNIVMIINRFLPLKHADTIREQLRLMEISLSGFIRGQLLVCVYLAIFYSVSLIVIGLDFGLLVGCISGLLAFIPYLGAFISLLVVIVVAIFQWWPADLLLVLLVVGIFTIGQILEGMILTPRLVGVKVGLHPVWVIFAILVGGNLFGLLGVFFAVPTAAGIAIIVRYSLGCYLESDYFRGQPRASHQGQVTDKGTPASAHEKSV